MIVLSTDKGKAHRQVAGNNRSMRLGSYDFTHNRDKFSISQLPLLCQSAECTKNICDPDKRRKESKIIEIKANIE